MRQTIGGFFNRYPNSFWLIVSVLFGLIPAIVLRNAPGWYGAYLAAMLAIGFAVSK